MLGNLTEVWLWILDQEKRPPNEKTLNPSFSQRVWLLRDGLLFSWVEERTRNTFWISCEINHLKVTEPCHSEALKPHRQFNFSAATSLYSQKCNPIDTITLFIVLLHIIHRIISYEHLVYIGQRQKIHGRR